MIRSLPYGKRFSATADTNGGNPPADPAVPPVVPPVVPPTPGGDDENKFRRLHEKSESEKKALADRLAALEAAEQTRKDAELSEIERATKRADEAEKRASDLAHERLVEKIARETGLSDEAREFLSGTDEATLRANATKLAGVMKTPVTAGTTTQPAATPAPTLDDKINAALQSGNDLQAIRLMREKQGITR